MKCYITLCPVQSPLYRVNPQGEPGKFACLKHVGDNPPDAETKRIAEIIHKGKP